MLRRIGVLASLATCAVMFAGVTSAQAANPDVGDAAVCIFGGLSGQLNPGIPNAVPDLTDAELLDIEHGTYSFSGNTNACVVVHGGGVHVNASAQITSAGAYDNIVCGTGYAHDVDSNGTLIDASNPDLEFGGLAGDPAGYQIPFVGGVGPLVIGPDGAPSLAAVTNSLPLLTHEGTPGDTAATVTSNYVGAGLVQITPGNAPVGSAPNENCVEPAGFGGNTAEDGDTDEFRVTGFLAGVKYQDVH